MYFTLNQAYFQLSQTHVLQQSPSIEINNAQI